MVLVEPQCFSNLRNFCVFFSVLVQVQAILLWIWPISNLAPCACFISWSWISFFSWTVLLCSSLFWGSVARLWSDLFSSFSSFYLQYFIGCVYSNISMQKNLNLALCISHVISRLSFRYSLRCASMKLFMSHTKSASYSSEELNCQYLGPLLKSEWFLDQG